MSSNVRLILQLDRDRFFDFASRLHIIAVRQKCKCNWISSINILMPALNANIQQWIVIIHYECIYLRSSSWVFFWSTKHRRKCENMKIYVYINSKYVLSKLYQPLALMLYNDFHIKFVVNNICAKVGKKQ